MTDGLANSIAAGETLPAQCVYNGAYANNFPVAGTTIPINTFETLLAPGSGHYRACGFKSLHPGGANFLMGDGSVHFVDEFIDYQLYNELGTLAGGEPVEDRPGRVTCTGFAGSGTSLSFRRRAWQTLVSTQPRPFRACHPDKETRCDSRRYARRSNAWLRWSASRPWRASCSAAAGAPGRRGCRSAARSRSAAGRRRPPAWSTSPRSRRPRAFPAARRTRASPKATATFVVTSVEPEDGLVPGVYLVNIECWRRPPAEDGTPGISCIGDGWKPPQLEIKAGRQTDHVGLQASRTAVRIRNTTSCEQRCRRVRISDDLEVCVPYCEANPESLFFLCVGGTGKGDITGFEDDEPGRS